MDAPGSGMLSSWCAPLADAIAVFCDLGQASCSSSMGHKRATRIDDSSSSDESDDDGFDNVYDSFRSKSSSQGNSYSDNSSDDLELYEKCVNDFRRMKHMKKRLEMDMKHKHKKKKIDKKNRDGSTSFSASVLTDVISALTPEKKAVIDKYGFGSLLELKKFVVPGKFAEWVARLVDVKSGDIIHGGKVISLDEESVELVLNLPAGKIPFPPDASVGRALVLSKFGLDSMPPISFFADKLISNEDLPAEDMLICFLVVALASFLCPNTTSIPSSNYFGVFQDIAHIKDFNWCGFVLAWLLDHIRGFNTGKFGKMKRSKGLCGCLYYLVVVYLDHIDFGQRQVSGSVPRISVWQGDMIQYYASLDYKSAGVFGLRPLLEYEKTCYYKSVRVRSVSSADELDAEFFDNMERVTGRKLSMRLKIDIAKLIDDHCFKSGMCLNMDVTSLSNVSREFQAMFGKMMHHICQSDFRSKKLVLAILAALSSNNLNETVDADTVHRTKRPIDQDHFDNVAPKLYGNTCVASSSKFEKNLLKVDVPDMTKTYNAVHSKSVKYTHGGQYVKGPPSVKATFSAVRNPLSDISNAAHQPVCPSNRNFIDLEEDSIDVGVENFITPDYGPSSQGQRKSRFSHSNKFQNVERRSLFQEDEDEILMGSHPFVDDPSFGITPNTSKMGSDVAGCSGSGKKVKSSAPKDNDNSPVIFLGSRSFLETVKSQTKKADSMYNYDLRQLRTGSEIDCASLGKTQGFPCDSSLDPESAAHHSEFKLRDWSSGGKVPVHGPRRLVRPSRVLSNEYVLNNNKFKASSSEKENYEAICALASSHSSRVDAIHFGERLHCNFWAFGESMKRGGKVSNFVIAAFCYHLYCRPLGHSDVSKRHFFFPNISENLLKDHHEVDGTLMNRAFERSPKARALFQYDLLYFPTLHGDHWFVFVVDIKDHKFFFLDSLYSEDSEYHQDVREKMIPEFHFWWERFVKHDLKFQEYTVKYPDVPKHSSCDDFDSGIYAMMFLEHWLSPRSSLCCMFSRDDIPNIRIKLANEIFFNPRNNGNKNLVITYGKNEVDESK